ncbi:apolipoprotein N-acyltransferase [Herbaspirillum sp. RTI4]|uniref:apolipoprotein N-acyltransferase n=1 Tax=Herbaspirillum sp. RTI4 TaxID=3048640 RepID=UPI002AB3612A|nr:apolipoprotein N-acyltransferase [Herbaspirillum sp. RTI4]MDY7576752.1 apolipoprotein N-acyltransferase [Herbaspirillum sp. RTI4]MEA9981348.1 apolipoprotein N-acyltransferase [Herbaspirillum sp. RTI4]
MILLALLLGAATTLAFAPFSLWPLQILTLAWLIRTVLLTGHAGHAHPLRDSAWVGWAYGTGGIACGMHWLYFSMHTYGGMPGWMAALAVALLAAFLGLFTAAAMVLASWLRQRWQTSDKAMALLMLPAVWLLSEWLRGWLLTGLPWISSGYAHSVSPLAGFAPLLGVYGVGGIAALMAGALALLTLPGKSKTLPAFLILGLLVGGVLLRLVPWTAPQGQPITVRLLQGNITPDIKYTDEGMRATLNTYADMIRDQPADLIATPETAIPLVQQQLPPDFLPNLRTFAQQSDSHLALGMVFSDAPQEYSNSVLGISPDPTAIQPYRYDKHHLVPFGEFVPTGFRWFIDLMNIPLGDLTRGTRQQAPFAVRNQWILPNICYEDLFGEEIAGSLAAARRDGAPQASILLNMSDIAWFGNSIAIPQHLQISQMRALETGRPMLRATNTGATAVIDPKGRILAQLTPSMRGVLSATVQGYGGQTPYLLAGNLPAVLLALLMLLLCWRQYRRSQQPSQGHDSHTISKTR